ncbi:hypothetical protein J2X76_003939 [Neorhizobium sp. 2083]|uniref:hypothetical protein n=1 Tax=Neorhizobium sp. 2083 TaxID=2817762 RepID=UPI002856E454|nr:hypothetical protein [Neorhizobium sp. 2083]MDR6818757.1 hypothetical protein [Neorhizobium sp. 2083]
MTWRRVTVSWCRVLREGDLPFRPFVCNRITRYSCSNPVVTAVNALSPKYGVR